METTMERPYTLKKLSAEDLFPCAAVINKIGFTEIKKCMSVEKVKAIMESLNAEDPNNEHFVESVGMEIIMDVVGVILANLENCKESLYKLLSNLTGMKKEAIAALDIDVFAQLIIDVVKKEEFKDFFKVVSGLLK